MKQWCLALALIVVGATSCWAQAPGCNPQNSPAFTSDVQVHTADQMGSNATATLSGTFIINGVKYFGHVLTVPAGVTVTFTETVRYATNNGLTYQWTGGSSGSWPYSSWTPAPSDAGHSVTFTLSAQIPGGYATKDRITVTVVNSYGTPKADSQSFNYYAVVTVGWSGNPDIDTNQCNQVWGAQMYPEVDMTLSNMTSGENQNLQATGTDMPFGNTLSVQGTMQLSFLQGDTFSVLGNSVVHCSAIGDFWQVGFYPQLEAAVTTTKWTGTNPGAFEWGTTTYCPTAYTPADYNPVIARSIKSYPYFYQTALCWRFNSPGPWGCHSMADLGVGPEAPVGLEWVCTHNP